MILEHRTYTFKPGTVDGWMKNYEVNGLPVQKRHLNRFLGLYVSEIGKLHTTVLMWGYDSLDDRFERRKVLQASPVWQAYAKKMRPLVVNVENKLLVPAPFFKVP